MILCGTLGGSGRHGHQTFHDCHLLVCFARGHVQRCSFGHFHVGTLCSIIHCHTRGEFSEIHPQPCSLYGPGPLASGGGQTLLSAEVSAGWVGRWVGGWWWWYTYQRKSGPVLECPFVFGDIECSCGEEGQETEAGEGTVHRSLLEKAQASLLH